MNLYIKIFISSLIPLLIIIVASVIQVSHVIDKQIASFKTKELRDKQIVNNRINSYIKNIYKEINILSSVYEVKDAIKINDNHVLTQWGKRFLEDNKMIFFVDLNGVIVARAHDEFRFSDSLKNSKFFNNLKKSDSLYKITNIDNNLSLIIGKKVDKFELPMGYIIFALKLDDKLLKELQKGTVLKLDFKKKLSNKNFEDSLFKILDIKSSVNSEIEDTNKLKEFLLISLVSLLFFLSIFLFFIIRRHLKPYTKLTNILSAFSNKQISLMQLRREVKRVYKTNLMHEINAIAKGIQSMAIQVHKDNMKLKNLSQTDQLTQVYNRRKIDLIFKNRFNEAKRYETTFSIILIDIDHFKSINDKYGHDMGDKILVEFAKVLKQNIRTTDSLARFGGEEFLIIASNTNEQNCLLLCNKLKEKIKTIEIDSVKISASFGYTEYDSKFKTKDEMFKVADDFLYEAKNSGRDCIKG